MTTPRVLVVGEEARFVHHLRAHLREADIRHADTADETEGIGIDVVVAGGRYPTAELTSVRVHPRLHDVPVVLVAPGRRLDHRLWEAHGVHPVTAVRDVAGHVAAAVRRILIGGPTLRQLAPVEQGAVR